MKNVIFEKLKKEFNLQNDENLKLYCDAIWQVYEENNNQNDFEKTINSFLKKFKKANDLFIIEKRIHFANNGELNENESLKKILKLTNWNNITDAKEHKFNIIIDLNKIYSYKTYTKNEFEVYIFEDLDLFKDIYVYFTTNIFYN